MAEDFNLEAPNQERDLNNNGILDIHEPGMQPHDGNGYQHQESYEVERGNTSGAPIVRHQREAMAHLGAAYSTANPGASEPSRRDRVSTQNAVASALERKIGSDPDTAISRPSYEQALHDIDVSRKQNAANRKKSSLPAELAATRPHKEDKAHGAEILTEIFKGLKAGHKHATQVSKERQHEQNQFEAEAMKLRRANDQDLIDHELALAAVERRANEMKTGDKAQNPGSEGVTKGPGDNNPGGGGGPSGGPSGGPGGPGPGETTAPEANASTTEQPTPAPANDVDPAQAPGKVAAQAVPATTVGSEPGRSAPAEQEPAAQAVQAKGPQQDAVARTDVPVQAQAVAKEGRERVPGQEQAEVATDAKAPQKDPVKEIKAPTPSIAAGAAKQPAGAEATGSAGMGAVMATVNPALGIAATAVQTQSAQKAAGNDHASEKQTGSKAPQLPRTPGAPPMRTRAKMTFAPGQPSRSLASPKPPAAADRGRVIAIPLKPSRQGGLHAQASGLAKPSMPVISRSGAAPMAMPRAIGVGLGSTLTAMMKPAIAQNDGPSLVEQMHAGNRSGAGAGR